VRFFVAPLRRLIFAQVITRYVANQRLWDRVLGDLDGGFLGTAGCGST
jgi:hypothetical protein